MPDRLPTTPRALAAVIVEATATHAASDPTAPAVWRQLVDQEGLERAAWYWERAMGQPPSAAWRTR